VLNEDSITVLFTQKKGHSWQTMVAGGIISVL
jgi:hypothetical protein